MVLACFVRVFSPGGLLNRENEIDREETRSLSDGRDTRYSNENLEVPTSGSGTLALGDEYMACEYNLWGGLS
jgi:hypothetical protein